MKQNRSILAGLGSFLIVGVLILILSHPIILVVIIGILLIVLLEMKFKILNIKERREAYFNKKMSPLNQNQFMKSTPLLLHSISEPVKKMLGYEHKRKLNIPFSKEVFLEYTQKSKQNNKPAPSFQNGKKRFRKKFSQ